MAVSAAEIVEKAIELGYDKCGIIPVEICLCVIKKQ